MMAEWCLNRIQTVVRGGRAGGPTKHSDFSDKKNSSVEVQVTQFVFSSSLRSDLDLLS